MQFFTKSGVKRETGKGMQKGQAKKEWQMTIDDSYYKGMQAGMQAKGKGKGLIKEGGGNTKGKGKGKGKAHVGPIPAAPGNQAVPAWTCQVCQEVMANPACFHCRTCGCPKGQTYAQAKAAYQATLDPNAANPPNGAASPAHAPEGQADQAAKPQGRAAKAKASQYALLEDILERPIEGEELQEPTPMSDENAEEPTPGTAAYLQAKYDDRCSDGNTPKGVKDAYLMEIKALKEKEKEKQATSRPICHHRGQATLSGLDSKLRKDHAQALSSSVKEQEETAKQIAALLEKQSALTEAARKEQEELDKVMGKIATARARIPLIAPLEEPLQEGPIDLTLSEPQVMLNLISTDKACCTIKGKMEAILATQAAQDPAFATYIKDLMKGIADELLAQAEPIRAAAKEDEEISELGDINLSEDDFPLNQMTPVQT